MKNKKKLPLVEPVITSHQFYALPLAIIGAHNNTREWLYNEFIQLCTYSQDESYIIQLYVNNNNTFYYDPIGGIRIDPKYSYKVRMLLIHIDVSWITINIYMILLTNII